MDWRIKCAAHSLFSLPVAGRFYYPFKRYVTRSVFRAPDLEEDLDMARGHFRHLQEVKEIDPVQAHCLEFGAGRDLINNLILWCLGVERQTTVDLFPLLYPELVNRALQSLARLPSEGFVRQPEGPLPEKHMVEALQERFGITYRAPFDLRESILPEASVDFIMSTNTLEHVPPAEIKAIMTQCRRLLAPGGASSFRIDYADHYSYADSAITSYNFLRYGPRTWRLFNPSLHYQNRLRHADYAELFQQCGFKILRQEDHVPEDAKTAIAAQPLARQYARRPIQELLPVHGWFLLGAE